MARKEYGTDNTPFFVLGCVRSGTTILRDIVKLHSRLESPEETHFFRWADPYGSPRFERNYVGTKLFQEHRKLDGISDHDFHMARSISKNRKQLSDVYGMKYLETIGNPTGRWFDKTPQNVYGILLLSRMYPDAKFIHIYRNPLNVVASLKEGRVMAKHSVKGAVNYWNESMIILDEYKKIGADRIYEMPYEKMVEKPKPILRGFFDFIGEDPDFVDYSKIKTHKEKNKYKKVLSDKEIEFVKKQTEPFYSMYGYK